MHPTIIWTDMKRRTLLQSIASAVASLPFFSLRLSAQRRDWTPESIATLNDVAPTVLPSALGAVRTRAIVDRFVVWARGYQEGVALVHGYGHPRLQKTGPTPVPRYVTQLATLESEAHAKGGGWSSLDLETRRAILDAALANANVRNLPPRPLGQHVVADLMAFYFRSSDANDECYNAMIGRETCRAIPVTIRKPEPRA
jgi:hypothetical protein